MRLLECQCTQHGRRSWPAIVKGGGACRLDVHRMVQLFTNPAGASPQSVIEREFIDSKRRASSNQLLQVDLKRIYLHVELHVLSIEVCV